MTDYNGHEIYLQSRFCSCNSIKSVHFRSDTAKFQPTCNLHITSKLQKIFLKSHLFWAYLCCDYAVMTPVLQQYNNNISSPIHVFDMYNTLSHLPFHYFFMAEKRCLYYVMTFCLRRKHNAITS